MGPGSTALPPATALAASPSPTSGKHDTRGGEDDTHDDCPFRQLLSVRPASCTLLPRTSGGMGRGGRLSDTRGGGKSVRFADTVTGPDGLPVTPGTRRKGDATTPYKNGVVNTGKFYRRSDGRFVTRGGGRRPATAKERVTPSAARPQAAGQYSVGRTSQYQQQFECRKNCQFKEQVSNRPHKSVHKTWRSLASEGRPRLVGEGPRRSRMKVTGVSAPRWEHVDNKQKGDASSAKQCSLKAGEGRDEVDEKCSAAYKNGLLVGWPKFEANRKVASQRTRSLSCPQNSPVIQRPRFRTSSAPVGSTSASTTTSACSAASPRSTSAPATRDVPSSASRNTAAHSSKNNTSLCDHLASRAATRSSFSPKTWPFCSGKSQSHHGVGCRYWRAPCPLPWFLQVDVPRPGPLYLGVLPGLYVGNIRDSKDSDQLKTHNITHILAIHDNARKLPCNSDKEYLCITASDSPGQNLMQYFPACNDFIHTARLKGGAVLIHCLAGMSRSVTVAVVYVMCVTSLSWRDALKVVRGARNVANPNVGFLKQLQDFESDRMAEERRRLKAKYPSVTLKEEDEQMAKTLLASYYHSLSVGEMCEGNCPQGVTCPRGICHPARRTGLFRRNSRESSGSRSSSPSRRSSSPSSTSSSPATSPVPPRRASPTPPSPLTRRNSNSSPQLTPPQHGSPNNQRSSSTNRSSMQASSPVSSPKRSSSPSSPKRGSSPVRSLSSSPNSSPATSPKHVYTPFISPRTTYTSPPGSPKRCPSPVASPKRSLSAPNSPQRTVKKATLSPRSMLRQCSLWQHSIKVNGVDSKSKYISGLVVVDGDRELTQKEKELLRSLEEKGVPIRQLRPDSVGGLHLSKQTSLPLQSTQEKSPTFHRPLQKQTSLPPQPKSSSSHPCHPTVLGSYLQIYRQSSLPEECEDHVDHTIPSSDQQLYRWITRQSQPPEPLPCPYDELFRQASLQESRYKPKSSPLNTNQTASEEKKNKHNDLKSGEKDETHTLSRLASDNQVDKTVKGSSEKDLSVSKTSCSRDMPATPATIVTPATPTTPATPVTSISPIMNTTSTPSASIEPAMSSTSVTLTTPVTPTIPATSITSATTTTTTVVTSSTSTKTTNSSESSTSVASAKPTEPVVSGTPAKSENKPHKEKEAANTSPKKGAAAKNTSTKRTPTPPLPTKFKQKQSTSSRSPSQSPKTKTPPLKSDHEQPSQTPEAGGETQLPQGEEGKSAVTKNQNQDSNTHKRHTSESPASSRSVSPPRPHNKPGFAVKQEEANHPRNRKDSMSSEPSKKDHKEAHLPKDHKHATPLKKRNSSSSMKHDSKPGFSVKKEPKPGSSVKQNTTLESSLKQDKKPGFPVKQDSQSKSDSAPIKDHKQDTLLKQDFKPGSPVSTEHNSGLHLHKEHKPESPLNRDSKPGANINKDHKQESSEQRSNKAGTPSKEVHKPESFSNKNQKLKFPLKQDQKSDSSSKHDQKPDSSLKKDQKTDSSSKYDQKSDSSLKKDKKSDSSSKQDQKSYSSLKRDKKSDSSLKKDQKSDSCAKQDHKSDSTLKKDMKSESSLKNEQKSVSSKQDQKSDSILKKDQKSDSTLKKDKKSDSSLKQDQKSDATLKKDQKSDSSSKQDQKSDSSFKKKDQKSESSLDKHQKPDSSLKKDHRSDSSLKQDQKSESSSNRDQKSESSRHDHKSKSPLRQDQKPDSCSKQNQKSESPLKQEKRPESPLKRDHKPGSPLKQEFRSGSPLKQEFRPGSPLKQDYRPGSPLIQDYRPGSPLKKDSRPNSPSFGPVVISRPSTPLSASPPPPKLPPPPQSPKRSGVRRRGSAASLGTDGRRTQTKPECPSRNNLPDASHQTPSTPSHAPPQTTGPQATSAQKQSARPSTPIQEQPRSSPPLPASPRPLPYYHNQVDQPACPPCLPIQSRPRASLEPLTCAAKPPSSNPSSNSNTVTQNSVSHNGVPPNAETPKPKPNSCPPRQDNIKQPPTDTRPTQSAANQAPPVTPQLPPKAQATNMEAKDNCFQVIHNKQNEPPSLPRDKAVTETPPTCASTHSSAPSQGSTFQNFHELFKKCSVKNQQQAEGYLQTASSINTETHQQTLAVQTSRGLSSK